MPRTRAIAYCRVSTDKQADKGQSLAVQRARVRAYADLYEIEVVEIIEDAGESAKSLHRPGLQRALMMLANGEADALLVSKLDRLTRSVRDLDDLIRRFFSESSGVALLSVAEMIDTRSASGRLVLNVLASVSQWEREAIGERTAAALAFKKSNGEYTGGRVPFGYRLSDDGVHVVEDTHEQTVIREARLRRLRGWSLRKVGRSLAADGFVSRKGTTLGAKQVARLLEAH